MKKIIWIVITLLIVAIIIVLGISNKNPETSGDTIKIGGNLALSSYGASWSENQLRGAQLAVKEINEKGGVLGRQLEFIPEDNKTESKGAVSAVNKLISVDNIDFLITGWTEQTEPIIPLINQNKIITFTVSAGAPGVTKASKYLFRTWPSDDIAVKTLIEYAEKKGYKKIGMTYTIAAWEKSLASFFKTNATEKGIEIINPLEFTSDTQDFKTQITTLKAEKPDAIFLATGPGPLERFIKQSRDLELNVPFLFPVDLVTLGLPEQVAAPYLKNIVYGIYTPPKKSFVDAFKKEYNVEPGVSADTAYDAIYMIEQAIEKAGTTDVDKVLASFTPLDGASGKIILNEFRDRTDAQVILMTFDGASKTPVEVK